MTSVLKRFPSDYFWNYFKFVACFSCLLSAVIISYCCSNVARSRKCRNSKAARSGKYGSR